MATWPVVVYNVQRLLAVGGSPIARALDATPANGWTAAAYRTKVARIAAVLAAATGGQPPAVLILIEVENAKAVTDVVTAAGWPHLVSVVPADERVAGWDVAISYDPAAFPGGVTHSESHAFNNRFDTRDLLLARLAAGSGEELVVLATHWPSRKVSTAQPERFAAAAYCDAVVEQTLKHLKQDLLTTAGKPRLPARSVLLSKWNTPLLVAGDFNDEPWDGSVRALGTSTPVERLVKAPPSMPNRSTLRSVATYLSRTPRLFNPTWGLGYNQATPATYHYDGAWHRIDQMLVSAGLLTGGSPRYVDDSLRVFSTRSVAVGAGSVDMTTPSGFPIAFDAATMRGVSDHLPLVADLEI